MNLCLRLGSAAPGMRMRGLGSGLGSRLTLSCDNTLIDPYTSYLTTHRDIPPEGVSQGGHVTMGEVRGQGVRGHGSKCKGSRVTSPVWEGQGEERRRQLITNLTAN